MKLLGHESMAISQRYVTAAGPRPHQFSIRTCTEIIAANRAPEQHVSATGLFLLATNQAWQ